MVIYKSCFQFFTSLELLMLQCFFSSKLVIQQLHFQLFQHLCHEPLLLLKLKEMVLAILTESNLALPDDDVESMIDKVWYTSQFSVFFTYHTI
jgi:hypothetical protein